MKRQVPLRRKILFWPLLFTISVALFAVLAELGLRLFWTPAFISNYYMRDETYHHRARPKAIGVQFLEDGTRIWIATNSLGLRDREYGPKEKGALRILVLGDSYTEAATSPLEQTSTKLLEQRLQQYLAGSRRRIEVINAGQISYSPLLEYLLLKNKLIGLEPDLVLLNLDMTDVQDDAMYSKLAVFDEQGRPTRVPNQPVPMIVETKYQPSPLIKWLNDRSYLFKFADWLFRYQASRQSVNIRIGDIATDRLGSTRDEVTNWESYFQLTGSYLKLIDQFLRERKISFLIFIYPQGQQTAGREWDEGRKSYRFERNKVYTGTFFPFLQQFCAEKKLDCHPLLDEFRAYRGAPLLFLPFNGHFTQAGEALLADCQYRALLGGGYLNDFKFAPE